MSSTQREFGIPSALAPCMALETKLSFDIHGAAAHPRVGGEAYGCGHVRAGRARLPSVFQQLVACIISIRTRHEVSLPTVIRLLERTPTPAAVAKLPVSQIEALIRARSFHEARHIHSFRVAVLRDTTVSPGDVARSPPFDEDLFDLPPQAACLIVGVPHCRRAARVERCKSHYTLLVDDRAAVHTR
jgi:hypothetical protein